MLYAEQPWLVLCLLSAPHAHIQPELASKRTRGCPRDFRRLGKTALVRTFFSSKNCRSRDQPCHNTLIFDLEPVLIITDTTASHARWTPSSAWLVQANVCSQFRRTRATRHLWNTNRWPLTTFLFKVVHRDRFTNLIMFVSITKTCAEPLPAPMPSTSASSTRQNRRSLRAVNALVDFEPSPRKPADCLPPSTAKSIKQILFCLCVSLVCSPVPTTSMRLVFWPPVSHTDRACPGRPPFLPSSTHCVREPGGTEQPTAWCNHSHCQRLPCIRCPESSALKPCRACSCDHRPSAEQLPISISTTPNFAHEDTAPCLHLLRDRLRALHRHLLLHDLLPLTFHVHRQSASSDSGTGHWALVWQQMTHWILPLRLSCLLSLPLP